MEREKAINPQTAYSLQQRDKESTSKTQIHQPFQSSISQGKQLLAKTDPAVKMTYDIKVFKGSSTGEIHESKTQRPKVTRDEVFIDITHSGVCGTDEHFKWVDMGLGHEGVGVVKEIGPEVKTLKV